MYRNILLPVDLSCVSSWRKTLPVTLEFAEAFSSHVHVMTVIPDSGMSIVSQYFHKETEETIIDKTKDALHHFTRENIPETVTTRHIVTTGSVYESIIEAARTINADLIVMSAHRPELKDYLLGPNAARVVRHSDRSVLVVRD